MAVKTITQTPLEGTLEDKKENKHTGIKDIQTLSLFSS